jgi:ribosomal protein L30E
MVTTDQLRKWIEEKKVTIGTDATIRALKSSAVKRVVVAANAPATTRTRVERYCALTGVELEALSVPNDELGVMCKKPFSISVLGIKK